MVDSDRECASIRPPSAAKPHLLCTGSHQIGIAERGQEPCSRRKLSCATRSARCAMSQHRSAVDVATLLSLLLLRKVSRRKETLAFFAGKRGEERPLFLEEERRRPSFPIALESTTKLTGFPAFGWLSILSRAVGDLDLFGRRGSSTGRRVRRRAAAAAATDTYPLKPAHWPQRSESPSAVRIRASSRNRRLRKS